MNGWQPDGAGIVSGRDCGGDIQRGDSYSARFRHPQLPGAVITRTAYAAEYDRAPGEFIVQVETEWLTCGAPQNPGDTETWSDIRYDDEPGIWDTADEAEEKARRTVARLLDDASSLDWDGQPPREDDGCRGPGNR